ncbi:hypothetical protein AwWohl_05830 [Gammaproteobacteria bacterium]|nr:hypothetical protein AwWohl_05830 [Gammaproteobacteria bacterium]
MIRKYQTHTPVLGKRCHIDQSALLIGNITLGDDCSIWPQAVIRGDVNSISIGERTNIQDGSIIHVSHSGAISPGGYATLIGSDVTIGHGVMLHGCTLSDACLIGMRSTILDGACVSKHSMLGACSLLSPRKLIPEGELWMGNPARFVRKLSDQEIKNIYYSANNYVELKNIYIQDN